MAQRRSERGRRISGAWAERLHPPARAVFLSRAIALSAGAGLSFGHHRDASPWFTRFGSASYEKTLEWPSWPNRLLGLEGRTGGGFAWRVFGGAGRILNDAAHTCSGNLPCPHSGLVPYVGVSMGYAFDWGP